MNAIRIYLRTTLSERNVQDILNDETQRNDLIAEMEAKFGKSVTVMPKGLTKKEVKEEIENAQVSMLSMFAKQGKKVILVTVDEEAESKKETTEASTQTNSHELDKRDSEGEESDNEVDGTSFQISYV